MPAKHYETIRHEKAGAIATLTMSRPERMNGMTNRMVLEAGDALAAAAADRDVCVLALTGAGRAFCPGADFQAIAQQRHEGALPRRRRRCLPLKHELVS